MPKTYHARVAGIPDGEALRALREGLTLDDGTLTRPAQVRVLGTPRGVRRARATRVQGSTWLEIVLTEGKNRQVRRMGAAVGHEVLELVRVRIGRLDLGDLAPGEWRELGPEEVESLLPRAPVPSVVDVRPVALRLAAPGVRAQARGLRTPGLAAGRDERLGAPPLQPDLPAAAAASRQTTGPSKEPS